MASQSSQTSGVKILSSLAHRGLAALMVHAIDEAAANLYARFGFQRLPAETRTMFRGIETIRQSLDAGG